MHITPEQLVDAGGIYEVKAKQNVQLTSATVDKEQKTAASILEPVCGIKELQQCEIVDHFPDISKFEGTKM